MITRLYIDNYQCFTNFEWCPGDRVIATGPSGSGKSALLDVLWKLRALLALGEPANELFTQDTLCTVEQCSFQTIELSTSFNSSDYEYRLVLFHGQSNKGADFIEERLLADGELVFEFANGRQSIFLDDGESAPIESRIDSCSMICGIENHPKLQRLTGFRECMRRFFVFSIEPERMKSASRMESCEPDRDFRNIASWVRHLQLEDSTFSTRLNARLRSIFPDFSRYAFKLDQDIDRTFTLHFSPSHEPEFDYERTLDQLSCSERVLLALYIIQEALIESEITICLDAPDQYLSPVEFEPWLESLLACQLREGYQFILVSKCPKMFKQATSIDDCVQFRREESGKVSVHSIEVSTSPLPDDPGPLGPGWECPDKPPVLN